LVLPTASYAFPLSGQYATKPLSRFAIETENKQHAINIAFTNLFITKSPLDNFLSTFKTKDDKINTADLNQN
jgi:hypothetical protein